MTYWEANLILEIVAKYGFFVESTKIGPVKITWNKTDRTFRFQAQFGKADEVLNEFSAISFLMALTEGKQDVIPGALKKSHSYWKRLQDAKKDSEFRAS